MENYYGLLIGWCLGFFSDRIREFCSRRAKKYRVLKVLKSELQNLRVNIAIEITHLRFFYLADLDEMGVNWYREIIKTDREFIKDVKKAAELIEGLRKFKDYVAPSISRGSAPSIKQRDFSFIRSLTEPISDLFSVEFLRLYNQICTELLFMNTEAEKLDYFFKKTFDSDLSEKMRESVIRAIEESIKHYCERGPRAVESIDVMLEYFSKNSLIRWKRILL